MRSQTQSSREGNAHKERTKMLSASVCKALMESHSTQVSVRSVNMGSCMCGEAADMGRSRCTNMELGCRPSES
ncbi:hypothetical protein SDJN03_19614, partial [Cucurbita argyrosperma subsp. sororia]